MTRRYECDVLVIGSGAGGAPTATLLAEAGHDVILVEEGPWVSQGETVPFSLGQMERQYRSAGVTVALGNPSISYAEGRCAGGGTEINSGLYRRPSERTLERWRLDYGIDDFELDTLDALLTEVEDVLSVQPEPLGVTNPSGTKMGLGATALSWRFVETPRWIAHDDGSPKRQSMTATYLPRFVDAGGLMLCEHRIARLVRDGRAGRSGRRVTHAVGSDHFGRPVEFHFDRVFVCGGAIQTPALLQRSGFRSGIGGSLAVHPTVKLAARFADEVNVPDDVPVHQIMEFAPSLSFGGSASHPGLIALALADNWQEMRDAVVDWPRMAVYYAAITSEGRGRVTAIPGVRDPLVTYRLTRRDKALLGQGLSRLALMMLEAGAEAVFPAAADVPVVRNRRELAAAANAFTPSNAAVMTVHICSTVPIGDERQPADSYGKLRAADNVWVNDASLLPDAPGVNPQAAVSALALRNVRRFIEAQR